MHSVKFLAVVLVVLQVRVGVSCLLRERSAESSLYNKRHNKGNSIHSEEKKPAAPIYGMAGFYSFIMLLWSRNQGKSSGQSLEPVGSEINNNF